MTTEQPEPQSEADEAATTVPDSPPSIVIVATPPDGRRAVLEYLTPDFDLAQRLAFWSENGYGDPHAARQQIVYTRLTADEVEQERTR